MENSEALGIVRIFFLEKENEAPRHEYALSQPSDLHKLLLEVEELFYKYGIGSEEIVAFLDRNNLSLVKNDFAEIQKEFYLKVYDLAEGSENVADDKKLIEAANPSYEFLRNDDRFEQELEVALKYERNLSSIREKVSRFEERRLNNEDYSNGTKIIPIGLGDPSVAADIHPDQFATAAASRGGGMSYKLWFSSLAAAILLIVVVWQPFHESNSDLYSTYISKNKKMESPDIFLPDVGNHDRIRGETNSLFVGLSEIEKGKAAEALSFFQEGQFKKTEQILEELNVSRNDSSQLLIFLAISQMHINDIENAKKNLDTIKSNVNTVQHDDVSFYLALYYLKKDERDKARKILKQLENDSVKYKQDAKTILQKLRWF